MKMESVPMKSEADIRATRFYKAHLVKLLREIDHRAEKDARKIKKELAYINQVLKRAGDWKHISHKDILSSKEGGVGDTKHLKVTEEED